MVSKKHVRAVLLLACLLSVSVVATSWATRAARDAAPAAEGVTVVSAQGREYLVDTGRLVAFGPDGEILFEHRKYGTYFDVDPVPGTSGTVEYIGVEHRPPHRCPDRFAGGNWCSRQVLLRTNVTTGETTTFWETYYPKLHKMHDFDRINDSHIVVADIYRDQIQIWNLSSRAIAGRPRGESRASGPEASRGEVVWRWRAREAYEYGVDGGTGAEGFTHINDVEVVREGWIMATLRNFDRTVFVDPGRGIVRNWTIGCEDCHGTLYEHHNSDYMPGDANTPPTVLIADSENDRIVEYRRTDGTWNESWSYTNARMHWPRDADRLPDGSTLVTDSNANRVFRIDADGDIVWRTTIGNPYEAERLGTGDESSDRPHPPGNVVTAGGIPGRVLLSIKGIVPSKALSAALFVLPYWAGVWDLLALVVGGTALLGLCTLEVTWRVKRRRT